MWALRLGMVLFAGLAYLAGEAGDYVATGVWAIAIPAAYAMQYVARRHALGWFVDERGERQKVESWGREGPLYVPTSRDMRLVEEEALKTDRRRSLLMATLIGWSCFFATVYIFATLQPHSFLLILGLFSSIPAAIYLGLWFWLAGKEMLYLIGYQDMKGAKVLDPSPARPGLAEVAAQKVHGESHLASEAEALRALKGKS